MARCHPLQSERKGRYLTKAVYTLLALTVECKKERRGLSVSEQEGAHHCLAVLTDLHNRGLRDILIACIDGLSGFPEAIASIYPKTAIQHCIIHQVRNALNYVASKHQKAFMADLKCEYGANTHSAAESALEALAAKWGILGNPPLFGMSQK